MAWKRGTQNNQAGEIRKGHIREFLLPTSRELSVTCTLKIIDEGTTSIPSNGQHEQTNLAFINFDSLSEDIRIHVKADTNYIYLHAHEHPVCVITCAHRASVPPDCIVLSEVHRANSKVCIGEQQVWTVYQGEVFAFDARDVSIGDTQVRAGGDVPRLQTLVLDIRPRVVSSSSACKQAAGASPVEFNAKILRPRLSRFLQWNIVTAQETYLYRLRPSGADHESSVFEAAITVSELRSAAPTSMRAEKVAVGVAQSAVDGGNIDEDGDTEDGDEDEEETFDATNDYRGLVTHDTVLFLRVDPNFAHLLALVDNPPVPEPVPQRNIVQILTSDNECFPVKRGLLRPCLALTSLVQAGRGKYTTTDVRSVHVDVDACTFDRVLLYLEHEARGDVFRFDPLIVTDLREAAVKLKIGGLLDACDKVLGSFEERVWKVPIRLADVLARNKAGAAAAPGGKRGDTLLIMSGMVLDITRWLDEHPGGSTIIPQQALNVDSTVFFEIYHASKQSFLYLKEFYIGELAEEDRPLVPFPTGQEQTQPSAAFLEELRRITPWRLKSTDFKGFVHKSF